MANEKDLSDPVRSGDPARKHWLDYVDVVARVALSITALWWAVSSFRIQKAENDKHLWMQINQQSINMQSQREMAEAQLASSLQTWLKCGDSPQRIMARQVLDSVSKRQAFLVSTALKKCPMSPQEAELAARYSHEISVNELKQTFLQQLSLARQYRSVGLQRHAADEYEKAYNELPAVFVGRTDPSIAPIARAALQDGEYTRASDLFERLFRMIQTP